MSYDIRIRVKAERYDIYPIIAEPRLSSPTYNLGTMFRKCMDWDFNQSEQDENGEYKECIYPCTMVFEKALAGLKELTANPKEYKQYEPDNGWGTIESAKNTLWSLVNCINEQVDKGIPLEALYMSW